MHGSGKYLRRGLAVITALACLVSCRKPADAVKSDLGEAGYQLTAADWFKASRGNDASALKKFVASGFNPDTRDAAGDSALHAAAAAGAQNAADFLMDRGLTADVRGAADRTPLMSAVISGQTAMVRWLLRQGADAHAKDKEGFLPLMLAVREGKAGAVAELAPYNRENLDSALLLAALVGKAEVIDTLTNYGASVYARMEDGRTPLMIAAQNGNTESVKLLLDIGASRMSTDATGQTAADLATAAGHADIAALISHEPTPQELSLETPAEVAKSMDAFVDAAAADSPEAAGSADAPAQRSPSPSTPIQGETLSASVAEPSSQPAAAGSNKDSFPLPPLVMRHFRERDVPVEVRTVQDDTATLTIAGPTKREVKVRAGETVPGTRLVVLRVQRRMQSSKLNLGKPMEVSVVDVRDTTSLTTREWISGVPSTAHDPVALIEDAATGRRYTASPGQRFKSADGGEFIISEVRPNQLVVKDAATGAVQTIPLRGPRG